jgi:hypothetical protein
MKTAAKTTIKVHDGDADRRASFREALHFIRQRGEITLQTAVGTTFTARASDSRRGDVIRFLQNRTEYARAYECCWVHYYNCNRTRIGMYCDAVDSAASEKGR